MSFVSVSGSTDISNLSVSKQLILALDNIFRASDEVGPWSAITPSGSGYSGDGYYLPIMLSGNMRIPDSGTPIKGLAFLEPQSGSDGDAWIVLPGAIRKSISYGIYDNTEPFYTVKISGVQDCPVATNWSGNSSSVNSGYHLV